MLHVDDDVSLLVAVHTGGAADSLGPGVDELERRLVTKHDLLPVVFGPAEVFLTKGNPLLDHGRCEERLLCSGAPGSSALTSLAVLNGFRSKNLRSLSSFFAVIILGRPLLFLGGGGEVNAGRSLLAAITFRTAAVFLFSLMAISLGATPSVNNVIIVVFSPTSKCLPLGMVAKT